MSRTQMLEIVVGSILASDHDPAVRGNLYTALLHLLWWCGVGCFSCGCGGRCSWRVQGRGSGKCCYRNGCLVEAAGAQPWRGTRPEGEGLKSTQIMDESLNSEQGGSLRAGGDWQESVTSSGPGVILTCMPEARIASGCVASAVTMIRPL